MMDSANVEHDGGVSTDVPVHHKKLEHCLTRKAYRNGKRKTAVKVFTVNSESKYLVVTNVHATGLEKDLVKLCSKYGAVERYQELEDYPKESFTQVFLIKFRDIQPARMAKRHLDEMYFYGSMLHVFYAPEYESAEETRSKILDRRAAVVSRVKSLIREDRRLKQGQGVAKPSKSYYAPTSSTSGQRDNVLCQGAFSSLMSTTMEQSILPSSALMSGKHAYGMHPASSSSSTHQDSTLNNSNLLVETKRPRLISKSGYSPGFHAYNIKSEQHMRKTPASHTGVVKTEVPAFVPRIVHLKQPRQPEKLHLMGDLESCGRKLVVDTLNGSPADDSWRDDYIYMDKSVKDTASGVKCALKRAATTDLDNFIKLKAKR